MLRVSRVHFPVTALGPGRRLGIWVQGCPLACLGCLARDTWDPAAGTPVTPAELATMWGAAIADGAQGLTISGGEPMAQAESVAELLTLAGDTRRAMAADGDILLYTGYEPDELDRAGRRVLGLVDAVVFGRFQVANPTGLIWRGSANQRLVPLTPRGQASYQPYLDHVPEKTPMQMAVDGRDIHFIGVPRRGELQLLEKAMNRRGVRMQGLSWRP